MPDPIILDLRGGRNGVDSPLDMPEKQCVEALNVDWFDGNLGRKRRGGALVSITGGSSFTGSVVSMFRYVPDGNDANAELWAIDNASPPLVKRLAGGTTWANVTLTDAITATPQDIAATTFNGKLFLAYDSAVDRLHVYEPALAKVRRVGLAAPGVPTITNTGSGSYAATLRYYRVRVIRYVSSVVIARSEPSASVSFTPSGSGTAARVTQGSVPGEDETHWEIEVSADNSVFYVLYGVAAGNPIAIGTTIGDDSTTAAARLLLETAEGIGEFTLPKSAKYLSTDGNHLLMAGAYESGNPTSRVYFTPVLGASDHGDDERIQNTDTHKGWVDLNEKDGGRITGLSFSLQGTVFAFKYFRSWKLIPSADDVAPYLPREMSATVGCIYHKTIIMMEDEQGNPAIGFLSAKGPYRINILGLTNIGRDVEDVWFGLGRFDTVAGGAGPVNLDAATLCAHGVYYADRHQAWWWVPSGSVDSPNLKIVNDVLQAVTRDQYGVRGGWALHDGLSAKAICSVMFAATIGASMSRGLKPYVGLRDPV